MCKSTEAPLNGVLQRCCVANSAKNCNHCGRTFEPKRKTAKYCTPACKEASRRTRQKTVKGKPCERPDCETLHLNKSYCSKRCMRIHYETAITPEANWSRFKRHPFCKWLIQELKEAGTVQVLEGNNLETLNEIRLLHAKMRKGKPYYELCHLAPVKGSWFIGLLHPANLYLASTFKNRQESNQDYGHLYRLDKANLKPEWMVTGDRTGVKSLTDNQILLLADRLLNGELQELVNSVRFVTSSKPSSPELDINIELTEVDRLLSSSDDVYLTNHIAIAREQLTSSDVDNLLNFERYYSDEWLESDILQRFSDSNYQYFDLHQIY